MKDQVEQLNKFGDAASATGIEKEAEKNRKLRDLPCSVLGISTFRFAKFDTSAIIGVYTLFRFISIARHVLKSLIIGFRGTKFEIFR